MYPLSTADLEADREWTAKMEGSVRIRPSKSLFAALAFFVPKKGGKRRKVIDYRDLNEITEKDRYLILPTNAFERLKKACYEALTLRMFNSTKPIQVETDASDLAIGACLTQEFDGTRHPIAYFSRKMTPTEQNYEIYDKELLAIVAALRH